jgi:hypothetical protein
MLTEEKDKESTMRNEYSKKGLNPDILNNNNWWEEIKFEEKNVNTGFFGDSKTKEKYSKFLTSNPTQNTQKKDIYDKIEDKNDLEKAQKMSDMLEKGHILDDSEDSDDYTEEITSYYRDLKEENQEAGLEEEIGKEDTFYQMYQDKIKMKEMQRNYKKRTSEEMFEESLRIAKSLGLEDLEDQQIIFRKISDEDYLKQLKSEHHEKKFYDSLKLEEEEVEDYKEFADKDISAEKMKNIWLNKKANKK